MWLANKGKYLALELNHILDLFLAMPWTRTLLHGNRTVNLGIRRFRQVAADRFVELRNGLCKKLHKGRASMATMKRITANMDLMESILRKWKSWRQRKVSGKHKRVRMTADTAFAKRKFLERGIFRVNPCRKEIVNAFDDNSDWKAGKVNVLNVKKESDKPVLQKLRILIGERKEADNALRSAELIRHNTFLFRDREWSIFPRDATKFVQAEMDAEFWSAKSSEYESSLVTEESGRIKIPDWRMTCLKCVGELAENRFQNMSIPSLQEVVRVAVISEVLECNSKEIEDRETYPNHIRKTAMQIESEVYTRLMDLHNPEVIRQWAEQNPDKELDFVTDEREETDLPLSLEGMCLVVQHDALLKFRWFEERESDAS